MPTYEYECRACGHRFDHWQQMTEKRLRSCPACRKPRLHRLVGSGGGLLFRGSGFYATDYKRKGGDGAGADAPSKGTDGARGGGDAAGPAPAKESAPAASPPSKPSGRGKGGTA